MKRSWCIPASTMIRGCQATSLPSWVFLNRTSISRSALDRTPRRPAPCHAAAFVIALRSDLHALPTAEMWEAMRSADERPARPLEWETIPEGDFVPGFDPADRALLHVLDDPAMTAPTQTVSPSG